MFDAVFTTLDASKVVMCALILIASSDFKTNLLEWAVLSAMTILLL